MSENNFFDQFFQIYSADTQRKSCSSNCELSENVVDRVSILCLFGAINQTKNSKNAKILSTSRGHRNFFVGQKNFSFSLTCSSKYQLLKYLFVTVGLLSVNICIFCQHLYLYYFFDYHRTNTSICNVSHI